MLDRFWPASITVSKQEMLRMVVGSGLAIVFVAALSRFLSKDIEPWLVAPIGASAVLVFGIPSSPLAQPWSVVGGNTLSALVGTLVALIIPGHLAVAAALAVALSIATMLWGRCLHPPGGASALLVVLMHQPSLHMVLFPFLLNSVLLVAAGLLYHNLTGRAYPHHSIADPNEAPSSRRFTQSDLDSALQHYQQIIDVAPADLAQLLQYAESAAYQRTLGDLRCIDAMSRSVYSVEFGSSLEEAWRLMREHRIKALPVVDRARRIVGIITMADFMKHAQVAKHSQLHEKIKHIWQPSGLSHSDKPEVVGQIMTRRVRVARDQSYLAELLPLFSQTGHHHLPVIDSENRLIGILTQTDVIHALIQTVRQP
jgi:CBS domain-containing membrane protein